MQKKIEGELMSIAHQILKLKNKEDVFLLKEKAKQIYEKASVLAYIHQYVNETVTEERAVEEIVEDVFKEKPKEDVVSEEVQEVIEIENKDEEELLKEEIEEMIPEIIVEDKTNNTIEEELNEKDDIVSFERIEDVKEEESLEDKNAILKEVVDEVTISEEFKDAVSIDFATNLFENAERVPQSKTVNDLISQKNIQIDLNDRIAFVKHLFEGNQEDFNRVISQLNSMDTQKEAQTFLNMVKKDYNWGEKQEYEERLLSLIEKKYS